MVDLKAVHRRIFFMFNNMLPVPHFAAIPVVSFSNLIQRAAVLIPLKNMITSKKV